MKSTRIAYLTNSISSKNGWGRYSKEIIINAKNKGIIPLVFCSEDPDEPLIDNINCYKIAKPYKIICTRNRAVVCKC